MSEVEPTPDNTRTRQAPQPAPVQEQILRTWDGIRFEDEPDPHPGPTAPEPEVEEELDYVDRELILKYNKEPLETSRLCTDCKKSNLIYFINHWTNRRKYKGRTYALTELFCPRCGSAKLHTLFGRNDIEYYYLGIKDEG